MSSPSLSLLLSVRPVGGIVRVYNNKLSGSLLTSIIYVKLSVLLHIAIYALPVYSGPSLVIKAGSHSFGAREYSGIRCVQYGQNREGTLAVACKTARFSSNSSPLSVFIMYIIYTWDFSVLTTLFGRVSSLSTSLSLNADIYLGGLSAIYSAHVVRRLMQRVGGKRPFVLTIWVWRLANNV